MSGLFTPGGPWAVSGGLLLDVLGTTAVRAYSLRKIRSAYTGYAIKVRRSSDNATQDIGFDGSNNLDTAALASFVGTDSGYIDTWYDQSTTADNVTQATTGDQPRIRDAGTTETKNSLPVVRFGVTATVVLKGGSSLTAAEALGIVTFSNPTFPDYSSAVSGTGSGGSETGILGDATSNTNWYESGNFTTIRSNNGSTRAASCFNGTLAQVSGRGTGGSWTLPQLGQERNNANRKWDGWIGEIIIFATALSSGDRSTAYTEMKTYWGTP